MLQAIEGAARADALIASNTSSLPIDDLAALLRAPQRFMGMHWLNPPEWTPGIELIPAQVIDPRAVEQARSFLQAIGKHPIVVGSGPGFVANRIQIPTLVGRAPLAVLGAPSDNLARVPAVPPR